MHAVNLHPHDILEAHTDRSHFNWAVWQTDFQHSTYKKNFNLSQAAMSKDAYTIFAS